MEFVDYINCFLFFLFFVCYSYQFFYILVPFFFKNRKNPAEKVVNHSYAVLVSARDEERVIGYLIDSIRKQTYPGSLVHIFVIADNCSDKTAEVARETGVTVYERFDSQKVGKGYALHDLIEKIREDYSEDAFDAFFVFDADNVLDCHYIEEMNKIFCEGYRIVTGYRNSKNYGDNWISAGYSLWFMRDSKYLNYARYLLGTSCSVSGTGFLMSNEILKKYGGWNFFLLTEDIEFSVKNIIEGEKIGYCDNAVLYDEQPVTFIQSWKQRLRWARGYLQVFKKYGKKLLKGTVAGSGFCCYDMIMTFMPAMLFSFLELIVNVVCAIYGLAAGGDMGSFLLSLLKLSGTGYLTLFLLGLITTVTEWKRIHTTTAKKILYLFTFPLYIATYVPISITAFFKKVKWEHIEHSKTKTPEEVVGKSSETENAGNGFRRE